MVKIVVTCGLINFFFSGILWKNLIWYSVGWWFFTILLTEILILRNFLLVSFSSPLQIPGLISLAGNPAPPWNIYKYIRCNVLDWLIFYNNQWSIFLSPRHLFWLKTFEGEGYFQCYTRYLVISYFSLLIVRNEMLGDKVSDAINSFRPLSDIETLQP